LRRTAELTIVMVVSLRDRNRANAAVVNAVDALLLEPLAYPDPANSRFRYDRSST
jgi:AmiR/NasT family two-component response regulator